MRAAVILVARSKRRHGRRSRSSIDAPPNPNIPPCQLGIVFGRRQISRPRPERPRAAAFHRANNHGPIDVSKTLPPCVVSAGLQHPGLGRELDRQYQRRLDEARAFPRSGARHGARLHGLPADRGFDLHRAELEELARDLSQERHVGAAPGALRGGEPDGGGDLPARDRADTVDLRLPSLFDRRASSARSTRSRAGRAGYNMVTGSSDLSAQNFGIRPPARARPALRDGRGIHPDLQAAVGLVGAGRHRRRPQERRPDRSHQGPYHRLRRQVLPFARAAQFRTLPAGSAGDRAGRRLAPGQELRRPPCRHDRQLGQGHRRR